MTQYYVDNALQGAGDHSTPGNAGQFDLVWAKLSSGDAVEVADGTAGDGKYTGTANMCNPRDIDGADGAPIVIQALNEGKVLIDAEESNIPIWVEGCGWIDVLGLNSTNCNSGNRNCYVSRLQGGSQRRSTDINMKRICAYDTPIAGNNHIFGTSRADRVLFEDIAGWGTGRKIFEPFHSTFITVRRGFGVWMGSTIVGPKMVWSYSYFSTNTILENCIGFWTQEDQVGGVNQPYGIFSSDTGDQPPTGLYGNMAFLRCGDGWTTGNSPAIQWINAGDDNGASDITCKDLVAIIEEGCHSGIRPFYFGREIGGTGLTIDGLTSVGGAGRKVLDDWTETDVDEAATYGGVSSIFSSDTGARVCKRYVDGVLTGVNLWPWPMQQRILDAFADSGRAPFSVEGQVQLYSEIIPAGCLTTPPDPDPPDVKNKWKGHGETDGGALGV